MVLNINNFKFTFLNEILQFFHEFENFRQFGQTNDIVQNTPKMK